jgi:hypothetical protein
VYGVEYNGDVNHLVATGETVRCELRQEQSVHSGKTYTLAPAVFHDIAVPADVTTATLVRGIRHEGLRNQVLGDLNAEDRLETSRIACDDASVQRAIDLVLAARRNLG